VTAQDGHAQSSPDHADSPVFGEPFRGVVAIDGPSGTGKSTVARRLADRLGARYLDTGAMYRAATLAVLRAGARLDDVTTVAQVVSLTSIDISLDPHMPAVRVDGEPADAAIRAADVTAAVSAVSAISAVRQQLVAKQRRLIGAGGIVVEGRDIGSVVWPQAEPKIFLTASAAVRARRRAGELGAGTDVSAVAADIERRDHLDSHRAASPLVKPDDAVEVDTTTIDIDEVVSRLIDITLGVRNVR
jgi:cytidylate kinase